MIAALLLAATSVQGNVRTVEISRGALVQPSDSSTKPFTYWDTSDTYIDASAGDDNFAGEPVVAGGPSKTILIRFGDLNRVLGSTRHVRKATLFLTIAGGEKPVLKSTDRLLASWNPGPYFTINALINRNVRVNTDDKNPVTAKPGPPRWSATWRHRFAGDGGVSWQQAGANGPEDATVISGTQVNATDKELVVEGLAAAVQKQADEPYANFGFSLHLQNEVQFFSSRAAIGHPVLALELDSVAPKSGPDLCVTAIQRVGKSDGPPSDGEEMAYKAHIKNVGSEKAGPFSALWTINGRPGVSFDVPDSLEPGAETVVATHAPFHLERTDHRTQTVAIRITPKGPDANSANNGLEVFANAKQIDVVVPESVAKASVPNLTGSHAIEDWVQAQARVFNEVYAAESRYSFAPDGAKERVSIQHILVGSARASDGAHSDGTVMVPEGESSWFGSDPAVLRSIGLAAGLPDFTSMSFPDGKGVMLKQGEKVVSRGTTDLYPGIIGYGDTRYEGTLPGAVSIPYEPFAAGSAGFTPLVATGLLSATDVSIFNSRLDRSDAPLTMPKTTLIKPMDLSGRPLTGVQLDLFQSKGGKILDGPPQSSITVDSGSAILSNREGAGPFGKLDSDGGNGTFLIRATSNGITEWGWLKAWEVIDTASRGNTSAGIIDVRFNLPSAPLDTATDLAKDRIVTDSTNQLPAKLGQLVSGTFDQEVTLGSKEGDWVEIDLGRDRTIGEISLIGAQGAFWPKFDVMVYITGQKPDEAIPWSKELDWNWTSANRRDLIGNDSKTVSVGYCAPANRIRFIRIINRSNSSGKLKGIRVTPVKVP